MNLFAAPPHRWFTSLLIVGETYGWLLHRLGEQAAGSLPALLKDMRGLGLVGVDAQHHELVLVTLNKFRGQKLTYVDASSLVLIRKLGVTTVWGTDHHLGLGGANVLPGSTR